MLVNYTHACLHTLTCSAPSWDVKIEVLIPYSYPNILHIVKMII